MMLFLARKAPAIPWSGASTVKSASGWSTGTPGFSLVEVAMALGIIGFVIVALLGLLGTGLDSGRESRQRLISAQLLERTLAELRSRDFEALSALGSETFDFDVDGGTDGTDFYKINVDAEPATLPLIAARSHALRLRLEVAWPADAPANNQQRQSLDTHVARY